MTDDPRAALERLAGRLDLGEYELAAYLAVLEHGRLTAAEIADATDVPQPRVYDTVRGLADAGLVELRESRPMEVLAVDPEEAFADVQSALQDLVAELEERYTAPARGSEAVSLVTSRPTILRYLEDVVTAAEYELVASLSPDLLARFEDELRARREAGVAIELLVSPAAGAPDPDGFDYRAVATTARARRGVTTPVVAVADGAYAVYATREALREGDRYGVVFNRSELGFLLSGLLTTVIWPSSTTLAADGTERPFPRRYATIRRCIEDLRDAEGTLYAAVRGRDVETGAARVVQGRVADVELGTNRETAAITLETDEGRVDVGGQAAALEDVEAAEIAVDRGGPPHL